METKERVRENIRIYLKTQQPIRVGCELIRFFPVESLVKEQFRKNIEQEFGIGRSSYYDYVKTASIYLALRDDGRWAERNNIKNLSEGIVLFDDFLVQTCSIKESIQYQYSSKLLEFWKFVVDSTIQFESLNATLFKKLLHQWKEQHDSSFLVRRKRTKDSISNDDDEDNNNNNNTSPSNFGTKEKEVEEKENESVLSSLLSLPENDLPNDSQTFNWDEFFAMTTNNVASDPQILQESTSTISAFLSFFESDVSHRDEPFSHTSLQIGSDSRIHPASSVSGLKIDNQPSSSTIVDR